MNQHPSWQYDEMKQLGKDYNSIAEVEAYDARHGKFRNIEKENDAIIQALQVRPEHVLIEFGTGTGAFTLQASKQCARVYAVDISQTMLDYSKMKATGAGIDNVVFCHGGFLSYEHAAPPVDAIVTNTAFHHLPDFWKGMALSRMYTMLKHNGHLYLSDVIFEQESVQTNIEQWIGKLEQLAGPDIRNDVETHIRTEFSTYDWIMDGLLERAGFRIIRKTMDREVIGRYVCRKEVNNTAGTE